MKKIIISFILVSFLFAPVLASAQTNSSNNLLIQLLTQLINQLEHEVAALSASVSTPSSDATLNNLYVNGSPLPNFNPAILSYNYVLPIDTILSPVVVATTNNLSAITDITQTQNITGTAKILITAQNGVSKKIYTINFNLANN